ncbi:hypothetical protein TRIATDRAFT_298263 [Trichoderma atroviride IMI 206040]|uniref:Uncharacterized protein n=1 Tax=Hypocrea atroviridis (strain ATCC 20476 / IMI 206040) TaxID=452589 RepID=G9NMC3_HYPAI|nr:uncharacterized protein TRIATDRAFT_298263 [Trichoderma atroviride IMI 206040]EHK48054.1 hypothetical protein TRIATDRAFT_298263 [Trichoderma atroviride IMI 206040]
MQQNMKKQRPFNPFIMQKPPVSVPKPNQLIVLPSWSHQFITRETEEGKWWRSLARRARRCHMSNIRAGQTR